MMRILLACLICEILPISQVMAIDGGPFGGGSKVTVTGTYAGVFVPRAVDIGGGVLVKDNSLGLFTFTVPRTGLASGTAAVFRNGFFYPGTIQGSADPDSARVTGVVNAFFIETIATDTAGDTFVFEYDANGQFSRAKIVANPNPGSSSATRIRGDATLTYRTNAQDPSCIGVPGCPADATGNSGGPIQYKIRGFKQSEATT